MGGGKTLSYLLAGLFGVFSAASGYAVENNQLITNTVDGVKWTYQYKTGGTIWLGGQGVQGTASSVGGYNYYPGYRAIGVTVLSGKTLVIPSSFNVEGVACKVVRIGQRAFNNTQFASVVIPADEVNSENQYYIDSRAFESNSKLANVCVKGRATVAQGKTQTYAPLGLNQNLFNNCSKSAFAFVGPNVKLRSNGSERNRFTFPNTTNMKVLVPKNSGNTTWNGISTGNTIIYYGPNESSNFDVWMGDTFVTFVPRTAAALLTTQSDYAPKMKNNFEFDVKVAVTNDIGVLSGDLFSSATLQVFGVGALTFGVNAAFTGGMTADGNAVVSVNAGCRPGNGVVTLNGNSTLRIAQSGTATLGGALTVGANATLAFNYTGNTVAPVLAVSSASAESPIRVKVTGDIERPAAAARVLTSGGAFAGKTVSLASGSAKWVKSVFVNGDGNLEVYARGGFFMIVK